MADYVGMICPYCKTVLKETDDVVVCSQCEMPHHKDCWVENQGCTTFGCLGTIQSVSQVSPTPPTVGQAARPTFLFCIKCGAKNNIDDSFCPKCGGSLSKAKQAVAQSINSRPPANQISYQSNNPYRSNSSTQGTAQTSYQSNNPYRSSSTQSTANQVDMECEFIHDNTAYYTSKFAAMRLKNTTASWNWASFFISTYWCFYRKLYKLGVGMLGLYFLCAFFGTFGRLVSLTASIIMGVLGNHFYMNYVNETIENAKTMDDYSRQSYMNRKGGTNIWAALGLAVGFFVIIIISRAGNY